MHLERIHTREDRDPLEERSFREHVAEDGAVYVVPEGWSDTAVETLIADVFFPGLLPGAFRPVSEGGVPEFLWTSAAEPGAEMRFERDIRDVVHRVAGSLAYHAFKAGIFDGEPSARIFYDEMRHMLLCQIASPEIALWATGGLAWAYGIAENFVPAQRIAALPENFQPGLSGVTVSGGETRKNILQRLRLLAGMSAVEGQDLTVMLPVENIDSAAFIAERRKREIDAIARDLGRRMLQTAVWHVIEACDRENLSGFDPAVNGRLKKAIDEARKSGVNESLIRQAMQYARQGYEDLPLLADDEEREALLHTVLSIPDDFIEAAMTGHGFVLREASAAVAQEAAADLLDNMAEAIWATGNPQVFFRDSTPGVFGDDAGRSALGGFVFLTGTEAPSITLDLAKVDKAQIAPTVRTLTIALEAALGLASVSEKTRAYRPVSLGIAGIASFLKQKKISYDSEAGRATAAVAVALVSGAAQLASAEIADTIGAFDGYASAARGYLQSVKDKIAALSGTTRTAKGSMRRPPVLKPSLSADSELVEIAQALWEKAYATGKEQGFRHAHLTALATEISVQALLDAETRDLAPLGAASPAAQIRMQAAVEPFLSGAVANPVALDHHADVDVVKKLVLLGWELGLKNLHIYRYAASLLHVGALPAFDDYTIENKEKISIISRINS